MFLLSNHAHLVIPATLTNSISSNLLLIHVTFSQATMETRLDRIQEFSDYKMASTRLMVRIPLTFSKFLNSFFFSFSLSSERIVDEK